MERIHINQIKDNIGKQVTITGFVQTIRDQKNIKFFLSRMDLYCTPKIFHGLETNAI